MTSVPRGWTVEEDRLVDNTTRLPVLARLPEASAESLGDRVVKPSVSGETDYRFDPPQPGDRSVQARASAQTAITHPPHMFKRGRANGEGGFPRRESPVLPQSNPFSNPRPRLVDSVAPAVRFLTMAALFTAAGVWVQMLGRHAPAPTRSIDPPKVAAQPAAAPAKNADNHTVPAPTATGPIQTHPESGARVGRVEGDDFASQNNSAAGPVPVGHPMVTPPHFLISSGGYVPRVQVADSPPAACADGAAQVTTGSAASSTNGETTDGTDSDESSTVARYPGFLIDVPPR